MTSHRTGVRLEALGLFVGSSGMRIAAGQPTPWAIHLVALAAVDYDRGEIPAQCFHDPAQAVPLRIAAAARHIEKCVVKRVAGDAGAFFECDQVTDEVILKGPRGEGGVFRMR